MTTTHSLRPVHDATRVYLRLMQAWQNGEKPSVAAGATGASSGQVKEFYWLMWRGNESATARARRLCVEIAGEE